MCIRDSPKDDAKRSRFRDFVAFRREEPRRQSVCAVRGISRSQLVLNRFARCLARHCLRWAVVGGGRGVFRAGVRFHIARDHHRVYEHDPPPGRLRSLNWTRFKRASFPFIACDEGLIGVRARRAIIRRNYVQLWQSDDRSSPTTQRGCSTTSRRSLTRQTPTTPQHHRITQAHARNSIARARGRSWDCGG